MEINSFLIEQQPQGITIMGYYNSKASENIVEPAAAVLH